MDENINLSCHPGTSTLVQDELFFFLKIEERISKKYNFSKRTLFFQKK
jgi:hypothetical protein